MERSLTSGTHHVGDVSEVRAVLRTGSQAHRLLAANARQIVRTTSCVHEIGRPHQLACSFGNGVADTGHRRHHPVIGTNAGLLNAATMLMKLDRAGAPDHSRHSRR